MCVFLGTGGGGWRGGKMIPSQETFDLNFNAPSLSVDLGKFFNLNLEMKALQSFWDLDMDCGMILWTAQGAASHSNWWYDRITAVDWRVQAVPPYG